MKLAIRPTVPSDVGSVGQRLRLHDRIEVTAMSGITCPVKALQASVEASTYWCYTCTCEGIPEIIYGVAPTAPELEMATPWMLSTPVALREAPKEFMYLARREVPRMQECAPLLYNHVLVDNVVSIKWLTKLGFEFNLEPFECAGHTWTTFTRT